MRKVIIFIMTSLDGYFAGPNGDLSWHNVDAEFNEFAAEQLDEAGALLFGRKTYELMAGYWPSAHTVANDPVIAGKMNGSSKYVFSTTMTHAEWSNTVVLKNDAPSKLIELKHQPGKSLLIMGSANLALSLIKEGLIDEFRIMVNPILLGAGTILFDGLERSTKLQLLKTRTFKSGNVLLTYTTLNN